MPSKQTKLRVYPNITNKQAAEDSFVFGAISAGVQSSKKPLKQDLPAMETSKSMCAVGAGLRGVKKSRPSDILTRKYMKENNRDSSTTKHQLIPLVRFAMAMNVSENYACGVNDGFENSLIASKSFYYEVDRESLDYQRGWHVGQTIAIEAGF